MKDFADFKAYCKTLDIQKIEDDFIWKQITYSHKLMMTFLEEYHNWLHR